MFGFIIEIPAPEALKRVKEVPSAKQEKEMKNIFQSIENTFMSLLDAIMGEETNGGKEKTEVKQTKQKNPEKSKSAEKTKTYSGKELAEKLMTSHKNVSTLIKTFNERCADANIHMPGNGNKNSGYSATESDWNALFSWRKLTRRK